MTPLIKLTNSEFEIEFDGKLYKIKKANLAQLAVYLKRVKELQDSKAPDVDQRVLACALSLVIKPANSDVPFTEDEILARTPANTPVLETLVVLGFINPKQAETAQKIGTETAKTAS